jgi:ABC-2 type transport system ATP-binding protein
MKEDRVIDVKDLKKSFFGKAAVNGATLSVKRGEIFGFLGPNGSGKTTTLRMLCGLMTPDSGSGQCLGYNVLTQSDLIRLQVGYMTQKFSLYSDLTVKENMEFAARLHGLENREELIQKKIEELGLQARANQITGGLSGGWKQRLALSVALLHSPKLLLLDEPTAGVDPKARRDFWDQIHRLSAEGVTTLVTTHYMDEAERCTRLAYIVYGDMVASGTHDEIIAGSGMFTWRGMGQGLQRLQHDLQEAAGKSIQASVFGNSVHVSGRNEQEIEDLIRPYRDKFTWNQVMPTLEDIFIDIVGREDKR